LRNFQAGCEDRIRKIIEALDEEARQRSANFRECEELAKEAGKMCNRWRRMTALTVEGLIELDREIVYEEVKEAEVRAVIEAETGSIYQLENEVQQMENLCNILTHFISRGHGQVNTN
jgi:hypothetical protein